MTLPPVPRPLPTARNTPGLVATILVGVGLAFQLVQAVVAAAMIAASDFDAGAYSLAQGLFGILQGLIALAALTLGIVGLVARGKPRTLAGIGVGGGGVILFGIVITMLTAALTAALYR